jgi:DNA-binding transcriptional LysR family regulator
VTIAVPGFSSSRGVKHAYALTVRAERVLRELDTLLPKVEGLVRGEEFDPTRSQERFRLALTDNGATILLPSLVPILRRTAPGVTLVVSDLRPDTYEDVAAGRIDTALSPEEVPRELESELIFDLDVVCLVGSAFKLGTRRFTLKQYLQLPHAVVETRAGRSLIDRSLAQLGLKRTVVFSIPFFVPAIYAIAHSAFLTVARRLIKSTGRISGVRVVEPPRELEVFPYFITWHPRLTSEPAHAWFREHHKRCAYKAFR